MGYESKYKNNNHQQQQQMFLLPMLCRVSIRDVKSKQYRERSASSSSYSSPKAVSCIGQVVKRSKNNKIHIGFTTPQTTTKLMMTSSLSCSSAKAKQTKKLRRFFSGKNVEPTAAIKVDVRELDPPLPVVKKSLSEKTDANLWIRRCGGGGDSLKGLQIQRIHVPQDLRVPPPTV